MTENRNKEYFVSLLKRRLKFLLAKAPVMTKTHIQSHWESATQIISPKEVSGQAVILEYVRDV